MLPVLVAASALLGLVALGYTFEEWQVSGDTEHSIWHHPV